MKMEHTNHIAQSFYMQLKVCYKLNDKINTTQRHSIGDEFNSRRMVGVLVAGQYLDFTWWKSYEHE